MQTPGILEIPGVLMFRKSRGVIKYFRKSEACVYSNMGNRLCNHMGNIFSDRVGCEIQPTVINCSKWNDL